MFGFSSGQQLLQRGREAGGDAHRRRARPRSSAAARSTAVAASRPTSSSSWCTTSPLAALRPAADDPPVDPHRRARRCRCGRTAPGRGRRGTSRAAASPSSSGRAPGSSATHGPGRAHRGHVIGQDPAGALLELDLDGADRGQRRLGLGDRPAGPPLEVGRSVAGPKRGQPTAGELGPGVGGRHGRAPRPAARPPSATSGTGCWSTSPSVGPARSAAPSTGRNSTRVDTPIVPAQVLPSPTASLLVAARARPCDSSAPVASRRCVELGERWRPRPARSQARAVAGDAGLLDHPRRPLALAGHQRIGARRLHDRHEVERHHEHRPAHAQRADQGAVVVEGVLQTGDRAGRLPQPGPAEGTPWRDRCRGVRRGRRPRSRHRLPEPGRRDGGGAQGGPGAAGR